MENARTSEEAPRRATVPGAGTPEHDGHEGTRHRVTRSIVEHGPSTAADLAERLELTPAGVRRHLDALLAEGVLVAGEQRVYGRRGRGRPAKLFALTDAGRSGFHQEYDELAAEALSFVAERLGTEAVATFARERLAAREERYRPSVESAPTGERARALAEALSADGYAASARPAPGGEQLCQHHCPVAHVAERFPQLCEAEAEVFARLLGTHVQRLATIAHGDGVCTTHVPAVQAETAGPTGRRTGSSGPPAAPSVSKTSEDQNPPRRGPSRSRESTAADPASGRTTS
ncbi:helix-turn-helix transcriptional regulator [Embleya sp. NPDC055664]|uniref:helix-turn-helix transcriptional regulator n=1 Tax=Embleya sp. NPDC059237 TaxID=3346784 RepID=UPI0036CE3AF4